MVAPTRTGATSNRIQVPTLWRVLWTGWTEILILLALGCSTTSALALDAWAPAQNLSDSPGWSRGVQLAQDPVSGFRHAVWVDDGPGNEEILTRRWDPVHQQWTLVENLSTFPWLDGGAVLSFNHAGHGYLVWTRRYATAFGAPEEGTDLMVRQWQDGAWQPEIVLDHNPSFLPGAYGLVLVEKSDRVVLFVVWNGGYRYGEYQDGAWSPLSAWDYSLGVNLVRVIADGQDRLHAAALGPNSSWFGYDPYFYDAYYLFHDGSSWTVPFNVSDTQGVAFDVDLAFDAQGGLHFVWVDPDSPYSSESLRSAVWERVLNRGTWTDNMAITPARPGQTILDADLLADPSDTLHLAWSEGGLVSGVATDVDLYYQTGDGTAWAGEQKVFTSTLSSRNLSLLAEGNGICLAWEEGDLPLESREILFTCQVPPTGTCCRVNLPQVSK